MIPERYCPTGQHWLPEDRFELLKRGRLARDCRRCAERRARAERTRTLQGKPFLGVDIDRIHYLRGKVNVAGVERQKMADSRRRWWS